MNIDVSPRVMQAIEEIRSDYHLSTDILPDCELVLLGAISENDFIALYNIYRSERGRFG